MHYASLLSRQRNKEGVFRHLDGRDKDERERERRRFEGPPREIEVIDLTNRIPASYDHAFLTTDDNFRVMLRYAGVFEELPDVADAFQDYAVHTFISVINPVRVARDSLLVQRPIGMGREPLQPFSYSREKGEQDHFLTVYQQSRVKYRDPRTGQWRWTEMYTIPPKSG
ncbi:hypothetical protein PM082_014616 [Marasmius tenuissimus]|nr:hypothetical protein PM082_014616 [Marasmius tenuissimus]